WLRGRARGSGPCSNIPGSRGLRPIGAGPASARALDNSRRKESMKRHICAAAGALVLALAGAGTATAGSLPILGGQQDVQSASLGDQSFGEQKNDADVTQTQGSFNVNVSPAIAILGDASTKNAQGNDNTAVAGVGQSNEASQSQNGAEAQRLPTR